MNNFYEYLHNSNTAIISKTERLTIRKFTLNDLDELFSIMKKENVMYAWEHAFTKEEVITWINKQINRYQQDGYGYFAVTLNNKANKLIGQVGILKNEIEGTEVTEIGYIFDDTYWKQGYATEAAKACIDFSVQEYNIKKLYCTIRPGNTSSLKLAERLSMTKTGEFIKLYKEKEMLHFIYEL